jgi:hypothetical protein
MGVNCAVLTKVKITNNKYPRCASGFKVILSKATSHSQGGIFLLWNTGNASFEVEAAKIITPNLLTFQLVTGYERFYVMGIYIPPNDTMGVDALHAALASCLANCVPLVLGNLNINFEHPWDVWEEQIAKLLDEIDLLDTTQKFALGGARCRRLRNDGPGNRSGWGDGTIPSQTTSWRGRGTYVGLLLGCLWSMIRTIARPLPPFNQDG